MSTAVISLNVSTTGGEGGRSVCRCGAKLYVINFKARNPPEPDLPLWKIPAPAIGTGGFGSTGWMSKNGIVLCAASFSRSLGAKFKYWFTPESEICCNSEWIGISGFLSFNSVLE